MSVPGRVAQADFDYVARPYRWLEFLTLGRSLEHCRLHFLPHLTDRTNALVFGDGDGRFLARLLQQNSTVHADAVDSSSVMLRLLRERCHRASASAAIRLTTHHAEALTYLAEDLPAATSRVPYDLVVTHFFLDCLTSREVAQLASEITPRLAPGALWVVSDFTIPPGAMRLPVTLLVRALYLAFRVLTGLQISRLPEHGAALTAAGFTLSSRHISLFGVLTSELWSAKLTSCPGFIPQDGIRGPAL